MAKNIEMMHFDGSSYEPFYPKTLSSLVVHDDDNESLDLKIRRLSNQIVNNLIVQKIETSCTWIAPKAVNQEFFVMAVGGGGGGASAGGGGGGGYITVDTIMIPEGENISIVCGAGGTRGDTGTNGSDGGATYFGNYLTAEGGKGGFSVNNDINPGNGGDGGAGGGAYGNNFSEIRCSGGNGGTYGGGGGGGYFSNGGNGGTYGGGGGGGYGGNGGNGGTYGGNGGNGGTYGSNATISTDGSNGQIFSGSFISILMQTILIRGSIGGAGGVEGGSGGGGGGYGGNGGIGSTNHNYYGGGGGGGYCGNGGIGREGGGGGGNLGGDGGTASTTSSEYDGECCGGGGGGLFAKGGDGNQNTGGGGAGINDVSGGNGSIGGCYILYYAC